MSKYNNQKIGINGETFDSRKEYKRYRELLLLEKAGRITELKRQVKFVLLPSQYEPDKVGVRGGVRRGKLLEREVSYIADFCYYLDGQQIVEDTKGVRTKDYIIKRKLMLYQHGIRINEV